jgi:hypothetical protein
MFLCNAMWGIAGTRGVGVFFSPMNVMCMGCYDGSAIGMFEGCGGENPFNEDVDVSLDVGPDDSAKEKTKTSFSVATEFILQALAEELSIDVSKA